MTEEPDGEYNTRVEKLIRAIKTETVKLEALRTEVCTGVRMLGSLAEQASQDLAAGTARLNGMITAWEIIAGQEWLP